MKKTALVILIGSAAVTVLCIAVWLAGFVFAAGSLGSLIHIFLLLAVFGSFGMFIGAILLIISLVQRK